MFNWDYQDWTTVPAEINLSDRQLIELIPDPQQTDDFLREWELLWKK